MTILTSNHSKILHFNNNFNPKTVLYEKLGLILALWIEEQNEHMQIRWKFLITDVQIPTIVDEQRGYIALGVRLIKSRSRTQMITH